MKNSKFIVLSIGGLCLVALAIFFFLMFTRQQQIQNVSSFEECAQIGFSIMESYPERCQTPDGQTFVKHIGNELELSDQIVVSNPRPNQKINTPLKITGQATGSWFFEASFPVELQDSNGNVITKGNAQAEGEWMTEEFVPFTSELSFEKPTTPNGRLILRKDNPSGLPENSEELIVPLSFN